MNLAFYLHDELNSLNFEKKILWFKQHYNLIGLNELHDFLYLNTTLHNSCHLTIDDGWKSTYDVIFPVMKKYRIPFTIFVSPEMCEKESNFWYYAYKFCNETDLKNHLIDWGFFFPEIHKYPLELILKEIPVDEVYDLLNYYLSKHPEIQIPRGFINTKELREMADSGLVEIGAHTLSHPILSGESDQRAKTEISESISRLADIIDRPVTAFAYPNGLEQLDYSPREIKIAEEAGIKMAFSVNPGRITHKTNPLSIPRWGSTARLHFGRWGKFLPSRGNQIKLRREIRQLRK